MDNNAIFAYFSVRFGGELSIYFLILPLASLSLSLQFGDSKKRRKKKEEGSI